MISGKHVKPNFPENTEQQWRTFWNQRETSLQYGLMSVRHVGVNSWKRVSSLVKQACLAITFCVTLDFIRSPAAVNRRILMFPGDGFPWVESKHISLNINQFFETKDLLSPRLLNLLRKLVLKKFTTNKSIFRFTWYSSIVNHKSCKVSGC